VLSKVRYVYWLFEVISQVVCVWISEGVALFLIQFKVDVECSIVLYFSYSKRLIEML